MRCQKTNMKIEAELQKVIDDGEVLVVSEMTARRLRGESMGKDKYNSVGHFFQSFYNDLVKSYFHGVKSVDDCKNIDSEYLNKVVMDLNRIAALDMGRARFGGLITFSFGVIDLEHSLHYLESEGYVVMRCGISNEQAKVVLSNVFAFEFRFWMNKKALAIVDSDGNNVMMDELMKAYKAFNKRVKNET